MTNGSGFFWSRIPGGRYRGRTIPEIAFLDPDYLFFCAENNVFAKWGRRVGLEGMLAVERMRNIKIPGTKPSHAIFIFNLNGEFLTMEIISEKERWDVNGREVIYRSDRIDLGLIRNIRPRDFSAYARLLAIVKREVFGSTIYPTVPDFEEFFSNVDNFHIGSNGSSGV